MTLKTYEITNITKYGIWILINIKEYFISFKDFPMFKNAPIELVFEVKFYPPEHLYWEKLDIDIELASLEQSEDYPLIYQNPL